MRLADRGLHLERVVWGEQWWELDSCACIREKQFGQRENEAKSTWQFIIIFFTQH